MGLNLCPFAKRELRAGRVRFMVSDATEEAQLLQALHAELQRLVDDSAIETSLLIHPKVLTDFDDYNQFLDLADGLLVQMGLDGVFQIASFHPQYQFEGTEFEDVENYTNRSPYPLLHLLREESLSQAIDDYPDVDGIPKRNIGRLERLGHDKVVALVRGCLRLSGV